MEGAWEAMNNDVGSWWKLIVRARAVVQTDVPNLPFFQEGLIQKTAILFNSGCAKMHPISPSPMLSADRPQQHPSDLC